MQRYEHENPGDLIHIDTKKLGRIEKTGRRATGDRRDRSRGAGREPCLWPSTITRDAYTELYPDESQESACSFLANAHAYYCSLGAKPKRLLTDNGSPFRTKNFSRVCAGLELKHRFTRPYRPQTNGKAERFIQSALCEWPTASSTRAPTNVQKRCVTGSITTTGIAHTKVSEAKHRCPGSQPAEITSCNFTVIQRLDVRQRSAQQFKISNTER